MTDRQIYAWIFLSVSDFQQPASLEDVIAVADFINHAIPMPKELQISFGWLQAQKLVRKEREKYLLTEVGLALRKSVAHRSIQKIWEVMTTKFLQLPEIEFQPENITEAEVTSAYKKYRIAITKSKRKCQNLKK